MVGGASTAGPAGSGCRSSRPRWWRWPSSRCDAAWSGWPTGWPTGRARSPTRRWPTSAAGSPRRPRRRPCCRPWPRPPARPSRPRARPRRWMCPAGGALAATLGRAGGTRPRRRRARSARGPGPREASRCWSRTGRGLRPADARLLQALADQTAVAFRNTALASQLADARRRAGPDHASSSRSPARGSSRPTTTRGGHWRRPSPVTCCRTSPRCPAGIAQIARGRCLPVAPGRARRAGGRHQRGPGGTPRPDPRRLPHPADAGRARARRCGPVSVTARPGVDADVDGRWPDRRFPPRVETAVYFCCAEAAPAMAGPLVGCRWRATRLVLRLRLRDVALDRIDLQAIADRVARSAARCRRAVHGLAGADPDCSAGAGPRRTARGPGALRAGRARTPPWRRRPTAPQPGELELVLVVRRQQHDDRAVRLGGQPSATPRCRRSPAGSRPSGPGRGCSSAAASSDSSPVVGRRPRPRSRRSRRPRRAMARR